MKCFVEWSNENLWLIFALLIYGGGNVIHGRHDLISHKNDGLITKYSTSIPHSGGFRQK